VTGLPAQTSRLDAELVRRGLARSRAHAQDLVRADKVLLDGRVAGKPSLPVGPHADVRVEQDGPVWVGRAAYKLVAALDAFGPQGLQVTGRRCLDVGASTGGFTQVLLHRGAHSVVAVDVGHDQLADAVRRDPRVRSVEGRSVRDLSVEEIGAPAGLVVVDLSFISLRLVLGRIATLVVPDGDLVVLVKPQFEVGRARLGKGGIVRRGRDRADALRGVCAAATEAGLGILALLPSPLRGSEGNAEYLGWMTPRPDGRLGTEQIEDLVTAMCEDERIGRAR
jgi:23S rRNA (cytidine1920-2'-O)/16S rRNA (cytidine1409-2'-O)-methyltransferase